MTKRVKVVERHRDQAPALPWFLGGQPSAQELVRQAWEAFSIVCDFLGRNPTVVMVDAPREGDVTKELSL